MKAIYIADDGTQFDSSEDCELYEWHLDHPHLKTIHAFDRVGNELFELELDETYGQTEKLIVPTDRAAEDLQALGDWAGFVAYCSVLHAGTWVYSEEKEVFVCQNDP